MSDDAIILKVLFFRTLNGREPVREWLLSLSQEQKKAIGTEMNYPDPEGRGIWGSNFKLQVKGQL